MTILCLTSCGSGVVPGTSSSTTSATPTPTPTSSAYIAQNISKISAGGTDFCALQSSGALLCSDSCNGNGRYPNAGPVSMISGTAVSISVRSQYGCVALNDGSVKCWGNYPMRSPAISTCNEFSVATGFGGTLSVDQVSSHGQTLCFFSSGKQFCGGEGDTGELGNGVRVDSGTVSQSVGIVNPASTKSFSVGSLFFNLDTSGSLKWWGAGNSFLTGTSSVVSTPGTLAAVPASGNFDFAIGYRHACIIDSSRAVKCWGENVYGELGNATTTSSGTLVQASGLIGGFKQVVAGYNFVCALNTSRQVFCWGRNNLGAVGDGTTNDSLVPKQVTALSSFNADFLAAGNDFVCALGLGGTVKCWGKGPQGSTVNLSPVDWKADPY